MKLHLVDGTFELFRAHFGSPSATSPTGVEVGATRGLLRSIWAMLNDSDVTHVACAFDHVIESFRNSLYDGYKTGEGIEPVLLDQFSLAERAIAALGVVVWPMIEFETDDALAAAAARWESDPAIEQIVICSPDKDMGQCVRKQRVVMLDRMRRKLYDEDAIQEKFGVAPRSIPDYLALVGDAADGIPGIPRWGARSAATVLSVYQTIEAIPDDERAWSVRVRGAAALAENLRTRREEASLFKTLTTLRTDVPLRAELADLEWRGPILLDLEAVCREIGDEDFVGRVRARA